MASVDLTTSVLLRLTAEEFRLIGLALAGKLSRKDDQDAAYRLNVALQEQRYKCIEQLQSVSAGAHEQARALLTSAEGEGE